MFDGNFVFRNNNIIDREEEIIFKMSRLKLECYNL